MKMAELFLADLEREADASRRVLERVPEGRNDWRPHEKSMPLGYLAILVATLPSWIAMMLDRDEFDMRAPGGQQFRPTAVNTNQELLKALDSSVAKGREALSRTTDEHLSTPWRFMVSGRVLDDRPRHIQIRDSVLSHLAHHRGQLTVYLRLNGAPVPAIYGPSADEPMKF